MHAALFLLLLFSACLGSTALWIGLLNRVHAVGIWRVVINLATLLCLVMLVVGPALCAIAAVDLLPAAPAGLATVAGPLTEAIRASRLASTLRSLYVGLCVAFAIVPLWNLFKRLLGRQSARLLVTRITSLDLKPRIRGVGRASLFGRIAAAVPGNEILRLDITEKTLALPTLPAELEGLSIAHLSDFHFSGRISAAYFREVVRSVNALKPDLIAITGDIVDAARCIDWIPETLGLLTAPFGVYYVLGNHDLRVDLDVLRHTLDEAGMTYLGSRCRRVEIDGRPVLLAGNERPWIGTRPDVQRDCDGKQPPALRILLSHSPDEIGWARRQGFDLMLAGHNHGGQIRLPLVGALLAPSVYGTRYACGTFFEPPTLLHVSRGVSSLSPVRFFCRPEVSLLRLSRQAPAAQRDKTFRTGEAALAGEV